MNHRLLKREVRNRNRKVMTGSPPRNRRQPDIGSSRKRIEFLRRKPLNGHLAGASEKHLLNIPEAHEILERNR